MDDISRYLHRSLAWSPVYIVYFVGIVLCLVRWRRHPRVSLLAFLGFLMHLGRLMIVPLASVMLYRHLLQSMQFSIEQAERAMLAFYFVDALVGAAAWALLIIALFGGRDTDRAWLEDQRLEPPPVIPVTRPGTERASAFEARKAPPYIAD
jgi:hypothetical protein